MRVIMDPVSANAGAFFVPEVISAITRILEHIHDVRSKRKPRLLEFARCAAHASREPHSIA